MLLCAARRENFLARWESANFGAFVCHEFMCESSVVSHARSWAIIKFRFARLVRVASATSPEKLCPLHPAAQLSPPIHRSCEIVECFLFFSAWHSKPAAARMSRDSPETRQRSPIVIFLNNIFYHVFSHCFAKKSFSQELWGKHNNSGSFQASLRDFSCYVELSTAAAADECDDGRPDTADWMSVSIWYF